MFVEKNILNKTIPLSDKDCLMIIGWGKNHFDYLLHIHQDFELNYAENAAQCPASHRGFGRRNRRSGSGIISRRKKFYS